MSEDKKKSMPKPPAPEVGSSKCPVEKCGQGSQRLQFCGEHFLWFKAGLINKRGEKPSDFDKKYQAYMHKHAKTG